MLRGLNYLNVRRIIVGTSASIQVIWIMLFLRKLLPSTDLVYFWGKDQLPFSKHCQADKIKAISPIIILLFNSHHGPFHSFRITSKPLAGHAEG